jgi:hypothetical protein
LTRHPPACFAFQAINSPDGPLAYLATNRNRSRSPKIICEFIAQAIRFHLKSAG